MRIYLIAIAISLFPAFGCESPAPTRPPIDAAAVKTVALSIEGMVCEGCEQTIGEKIGALAGVESCTASHVEKNAVVRYDPGQISPQEIAEAITALGYKAKTK